MSYESLRHEKEKEIVGLLSKTKDLEILDEVRDILEQEPIYISDFINEMFDKNYDDCYNNEEIRKAFEHCVREQCLELGYCGGTFRKIKPDSDNIDHWCELYVVDCGHEQDLNIWISEGCPLFDSTEIAWVIFNIYCGKVTLHE